MPAKESTMNHTTMRRLRWSASAKLAAASAVAVALPLLGAAPASADTAAPAGAYGAHIAEYASNTASAPSLTYKFANGTVRSKFGTVTYVGIPTSAWDQWTGRSDVFFRTADGHLRQVVGCTLDAQGFCIDPSHDSLRGTVRDLGGQLTSSPTAAATTDGSAAAFVRGPEGALWENRNGVWKSLGGVFVGDPTAVSFEANRQMDVFVVNAGHQLWLARSTDDGATFEWHFVQKVDSSSDATGVAVDMAPSSAGTATEPLHYVFAQLTTGPGHHTAHFWSLADPATGTGNQYDYDSVTTVSDSTPWATSAPVLEGGIASELINGRVMFGSAAHFTGFSA
jgi:hypothetical protein